jgi:DNA-binding CsgD family transcriptional regulator
MPTIATVENCRVEGGPRVFNPEPSREQAELLDREDELALIESALASAASGVGGLVLVHGPAGIGRTRLVASTVELARERNFETCVARCGELEREYRFAVIRDLLERRTLEFSPAERSSALSGRAVRTLPALGLGPSGAVGNVRPEFDTLLGLDRLVVKLAAARPLLLAVDDLQWCDQASMRFFAYLARRLGDRSILIVGAWRKGEHGVCPASLRALRSEPQTLWLTPRPLGWSAVREILARELGEDPHPSVVESCLDRTGGVPFLVCELAAALRSERAGAGREAVRTLNNLTPASVRRAVTWRLAHRRDAVRDVARAVAVLGDGCAVAEAAEICQLSSAKARHAADALARADILAHLDGLTFAHPVIASAVSLDIEPAHRADWHARAVRLLARSGADAERIARHLLQTEPAGDLRSSRLLRVAARAAVDRQAAEVAQTYLRRALIEAADPRERAAVLAALGDVELETGQYEHAILHLDESVRAAEGPEQLVPRAIAHAQATAGEHGCADAIELLRDCAGQLATGADQDHALRLRAAIIELALLDERAAAGVSPMLDDCEDLQGATATERSLLAVCAGLRAMRGDTTADAMRILCERVLVRDTQVRDECLGAPAFLSACVAALVADEVALVERALKQASGSVKPGASEAAIAICRAQVALSRGDVADAERDADTAAARVCELAPSALNSRLVAGAASAVVLAGIARDRVPHADRLLETLASRAGTSEPWAGELAALRARLLLASRRPREALVHCSLAATHELRTGNVGPAPWWRGLAALATHHPGDGSRALDLAEDHLERARRWAAPSLVGSALLVRAAVDDGGTRCDLIEEAIAVLAPTPARLQLAHAYVELGSALRRESRRKAAHAQLMRGADLAHRCGAVQLADRARAELRSLGARPRRRAFSGLDALTASERRVVELAARPMTKRQIAQELTVTIKTVEGQLSAAYRKLDVHSRAELDGILRNERNDRDARPMDAVCSSCGGELPIPVHGGGSDVDVE